MIAASAFWIALLGAGLAVVLLAAAGLTLLRLFGVAAPSARSRRQRPQLPRAGSEQAGEVEEAREETRRARQVASIAGTLELDLLLSRVLDAAVSTCRAEAAAVSLAKEESGGALVRTLNFGANETPPSLDAFRNETHARALAMRYSYTGADPSSQLDPIRSGLVVPLAGEEEASGTLAVYWRRAQHDASDEELAALEELAESSGRAIANARRYRELHELAVLDALTGLYNRRYFDEVLAREVKRAHRYDRRLALVFIDLDNFKAINDRIGYLGADGVLAEVAALVRSVIRSADIPCRIGGDEFAVILPESALLDSEQLYQRLRVAMDGRPIGRTERLHLSAGIAELRRDDDSTSLFQRADQALFRAKRAGKDQVVAADDDRIR